MASTCHTWGAGLGVVAAVMAAPSLVSATVKVDDDLKTVYDGCVIKFRAVGLGGVVDQLGNSSHDFSFERTDLTPNLSIATPLNKSAARDGTGTGGITKWNPTDTSKFPDGVAADPCATLYHEMRHDADYDKGTNYDGLLPGTNDNCVLKNGAAQLDTHIVIAEVEATRAENEYRRSQNLSERTTYGRYSLPAPEATCAPPPPFSRPQGCNGGCSMSQGDPHLTTFDQARYDLQAVGELILTRSLSDDLEVQVRQAPLFPEQRTISVNTAIAASVAGDRVGAYLTDQGVVVRINGMPTDLSSGPSILSHGGTVSLLDDGATDIRWPDGSDLVVHPILGWGLTLAMSLVDARHGAVEGVLGNFDGDPANDLVVHGGSTLAEPPAFDSLYPGFADSWRVEASRSLFDYEAGESTETFTDRTFPSDPASPDDLPAPARAAAEAICRDAGVFDPVSLSACTLDVALTGQAVFATDAARAQAFGTTTLAVTEPGTTATLIFPAIAGQKIFVNVPSSTLPDDCEVLALRGPDQAYLRTGCIFGGTGFIDATVLPTTGLYTVVLDPRGRTGEARIMVITDTDQEGAITLDGAEVNATIAQPGAVARFTFDGTAGQKVFVEVPSSTLPDDCDVLTLFGPDNAVLGQGCILSGMGHIDGTVLPTTGTYTVVLDPRTTVIGKASLRLHT